MTLQRVKKGGAWKLKYAKLELVCITSLLTELKKFSQYIKEKYAERGVIRRTMKG